MTRRVLTAIGPLWEKEIDNIESLWTRAKRKLSIYVRGRNRVITLDGCRFDMREIPDNSMKLELLTGRYERPERDAVRRHIQAEWPVVELGGCIGVVACVTNKLLKNAEAHVVLEANPLAISSLKSNRDRNRCSFKILNRALAYGSDTVTFQPTLNFWGNSLDHNGGQPPVTVPATQLSQILDDQGFEKFALICDIEGYEFELVMQEPDALSKAALIILEVHPHMIGEDKVETLLSKLADMGFKTIDRSALVVVLGRASD